MANPVPTTSCGVQIQIWVDDNAVTQGSTAGVYLVDNQVANGSTNEGSSNLATTTSQGTSICWQAFLINPKSTASVSIASVGNSQAWGFSGQPGVAPDNPSAYTGTAQSAGSFTYPLSINVFLAGGSAVTIPLTPGINVSA